VSLSDFTPKEITGPRGQWSLTAQKRKGNPERASAAQNWRFAPGVGRTRFGTDIIYHLTGVMNGMFNWIAPNGVNWVIYRNGTTIEALEQGVGTRTLLSSIGTTYRPSNADLDIWDYFCGYDTAGYGQIQCRIFDGVNVDKAFAPPIIFTNATITEDTTTGNVTIGNHYFGFVYQNRSGFLGVPTTDVRYAVTATTNSSPNTFTAPGNTMANGDVVNGTGFTGDTSGNVENFIVANVSGDTFQLEDPATSTLVNGTGVYTGGGVIIDPLTFETTVSPDRLTITVTVPARLDGGTNPAGAQATLFLIATPVSNPDQWFFVPTATGNETSIVALPVPYNTPTTLTFVYDIDDFSLEQGDSANNQFLLFSQNPVGTAGDGIGPFNPSFVVAYGQRMCYGNGSTMYASDINQPQQIAPDNNAVTMPNQRQIGAAFALPGGTDLYLTGEKWIARVTDNSDIPATWSQPVKVSDALGSPLPNCVCFKTSGGWVWMATEGGIYLFSGLFQDKPVTYLAGDVWAQVNWSAAYAIELADNTKELRLYVAVPLGTAVTPTNVVVIDYQNCADGPNFEEVDISVDVYDRATFGGIGAIYEADTQSTNIWIGPPTGGGNLVKFVATALNDNATGTGTTSVPINWFWESGLVRSGRELNTKMIRIGGMDIWARGNSVKPSDMVITVYGPDHQQSVSPALCSTGGVPVVLTENPGITYMAGKFDMRQIENFTVRFGANAVDCWMELSALTPYVVPDLQNR
jgi:hypothetical protein